MSLLITTFLAINASHGTLPPLTMPRGSGAARLRSPVPKRDPPRGRGGACSPPQARSPSGYGAAPGAAPRGPAGAGPERRPRPDPALSPCRALTCL